MRKTSSAVLATVLTAILLGIGSPSAQAQAPRRVQLVNFDTTPWRYFTNGTDLPTQTGNMWRSRTFNDSAWPVGNGLIGVETTPASYPYTFNTMFPAYDNNIFTYYFRAHFNMSASDNIFPLTLVMSNLCDDGCLAYVNSNLVATIRVTPNAAYNAAASGGPATEGAYEPPSFASNVNYLVTGDNVVAVEVHQNAVGSSDIVNGVSLTAIVPVTLTLTQQPPSQVSAEVGSAYSITAGVSGGPGLYQWQTNNGSGTFVNVAGAGANGVSTPGGGPISFTTTPLAVSTLIYRLVVSNGLNTIISGNSTVTTTFDTTGPIMLSATVQEEALQTNRIVITWNEKLAGGPFGPVCPGCGTNFTVVMAASNVTVTVSNILYNPSGGPAPDFLPITRLTMSTTNWFRGSNYYIIANRVRDAQNNVIAPNSVIGVGWPTTVNTNVVDWSSAWEFHTDWASGDFTIYQQPWNSLNYDTATNGYWGGTGGFLAAGVFYKDTAIDPGSYIPCRGQLGWNLSYVRNPTLFRTTFVWPTNLATNVTLRLSAVVDDGYVAYLNGTELPAPVGRVNAPAGVPVDENLFSTSEYPDGQCNSNNVNVVLRPGTNLIAVGVCQFATESANGGDIYFGMRLDVSQTTYRTSPVPANGSPVRLTATRMVTPPPRLAGQNVMFTWPTNIYGYALEYTTNITTVRTTNGQIRTTNTITGPWYQAQTNMAIGMVTNYPAPPVGKSGPAWIFRLRKVP